MDGLVEEKAYSISRLEPEQVLQLWQDFQVGEDPSLVEDICLVGIVERVFQCLIMYVSHVLFRDLLHDEIVLNGLVDQIDESLGYLGARFPVVVLVHGHFLARIDGMT